MFTLCVRPFAIPCFAASPPADYAHSGSTLSIHHIAGECAVCHAQAARVGGYAPWAKAQAAPSPRSPQLASKFQNETGIAKRSSSPDLDTLLCSRH